MAKENLLVQLGKVLQEKGLHPSEWGFLVQHVISEQSVCEELGLDEENSTHVLEDLRQNIKNVYVFLGRLTGTRVERYDGQVVYYPVDSDQPLFVLSARTRLAQ